MQWNFNRKKVRKTYILSTQYIQVLLKYKLSAMFLIKHAHNKIQLNVLENLYMFIYIYNI